MNTKKKDKNHNGNEQPGAPEHTDHHSHGGASVHTAQPGAHSHEPGHSHGVKHAAEPDPSRTPAAEPQKEAAPPKDPAAEKIAALEKETAELKDKFLRVTAEFDNYRKRTFKEMSAQRVSVAADTVIPFIQLYDQFSMAMTASEKSDNAAAVKEGLKMILSGYKKAFEDLGFEEIKCAGADFDPNIHEAVAREASETVPAGKIIKQWRAGFKLGDRIVRHPAVVVSSGKNEKPAAPAGGN
jgi:molecular chaperone GrpE